MKKQMLKNLELVVYEETLENGLRIFVVPNKLVNNIYATFSTKYGSNVNEFVPLGETKMIEVPLGIAHFLEHKMFEMEDGIDPFTFYSEKGADANAFTSFDKTSYIFSGVNHFKENINYLLDYVQKIYLTKENVEKEKGIIEQEITMYQDDPFWVMYETILENLIVKNPSRYPIAGTVESIYKITQKDLERCYNTFYHPSNMFVVVTGNVDPEEVIETIAQNQSKKKYKKVQKIEIKKYKEPTKIVKEKVSKKMNITIPKISIGYKILKPKEIEQYTFKQYISLYFDILFGETSNINEELKKQNLTTLDIDLTTLNIDDYMIVILSFESNKYDKVIELIADEINNSEIDESEFERKRKILIASSVFMSDDIFSVNNKIMNNIIQYDKIIYNDYDICKNLDYDNFIKETKKIDFNNKTMCIIKPNN